MTDHLRFPRVPDWDDDEGYPETTAAYMAAGAQRVREAKIAHEEWKEFQRMAIICVMRNRANKTESCREFRKQAYEQGNWHLMLPPKGIETDSVTHVRPDTSPAWQKKHQATYGDTPLNYEATRK